MRADEGLEQRRLQQQPGSPKKPGPQEGKAGRRRSYAFCNALCCKVHCVMMSIILCQAAPPAPALPSLRTHFLGHHLSSCPSHGQFRSHRIQFSVFCLPTRPESPRSRRICFPITIHPNDLRRPCCSHEKAGGSDNFVVKNLWGQRPSRRNNFTEQAGIVHFGNPGGNSHTGSEPLKSRRIRTCGAETILADDDPIPGGLVIDLAD